MNTRHLPFALGTFFAAFAGAMLLSGIGLGQVPWFVSRASGIVAYALLSTSVVLGLLVSTRLGDRIAPRAFHFDIHQFVSVLALGFIAIHMLALLFDGFLRFSPIAILVPFTAPEGVGGVAWGVFAAWVTALVMASSWARKQVGQRAWRRLHYLSFLGWLLALIHGITAQTSTTPAPALYLYVVSAGLIAGLLSYRILYRKPARVRTPVVRPATRPAVSTPRSELGARN